VSRSLGKTIARKDYAVTLDQVFPDVLNACAGARTKSRGTWLGPDMQKAYCELHEQGHSHSVEVWRDGAMIGGLYGVSVGRAFFGESMFSHANDASKIALYYLCEQLKRWSYALIDCQISSAHLSSLGSEEISRRSFLELLAPAVHMQGQDGHWQFDLEVEVPNSALHLPQALLAAR
jgi:leucyl/phenylalanyl-tRNA--protein transferase